MRWERRRPRKVPVDVDPEQRGEARHEAASLIAVLLERVSSANEPMTAPRDPSVSESIAVSTAASFVRTAVTSVSSGGEGHEFCPRVSTDRTTLPAEVLAHLGFLRVGEATAQLPCAPPPASAYDLRDTAGTAAPTSADLSSSASAEAPARV